MGNLRTHFALTALIVMLSPCNAWDKTDCSTANQGICVLKDDGNRRFAEWNTDGSRNIYLVDSIQLNADTCLIIHTVSDNMYYLLVESPINLRKLKSRDLVRLDDTYILDVGTWESILQNDDAFPLSSKIRAQLNHLEAPTPLIEIKGHDKKWYIVRYAKKPDFFYLFLIQADLYDHFTASPKKNKRVSFRAPKAYYRVLIPVWE